MIGLWVSFTENPHTKLFNEICFTSCTFTKTDSMWAGRGGGVGMFDCEGLLPNVLFTKGS